MTHTAFFYGTLMATPVLHRVIHNPTIPSSLLPTLTTRPAILQNHTRHRVRHADYPAVVPSDDQGACVRGVLVSGLSDADIWRLDVFEGEEYERRRVRVRVLDGGEEEGEGEEVDAETYIWIAGAERLEPQEWDFDEFVREKMRRWVGGSEEERDSGFKDVDDAVAALQNDPTGGRGFNGQITRALENGSEAGKTMIRSAV
ncbi:uncharacterized protein EI97DRAFT_436750 [Westerdykella ornata]|uniref:Putative gamma-glutamylcyclotransferase n=1 Tax=Westerdykella ornata TaxID=318751 RepID=A0A6A6J8Y3_WESOR|nr:uncharacterized protein EI97DRAFT_436750 [Westerdykella ornata]KAF2272664.1 hypothetical protein EI97DRAFT_436750 [Westerdykella ornata]